jgi:hypothetical protein
MAREIVTSENREEFMEKKLAERAGMKPMFKPEEMMPKVKAKKMDDDQTMRAIKDPRYAKLKMKLGKKGAMDAILKEMNEKQ